MQSSLPRAVSKSHPAVQWMGVRHDHPSMVKVKVSFRKKKCSARDTRVRFHHAYRRASASSSASAFSASWGLAWPFEARMTWPTRNLMLWVLPRR